MLKLNRITDYAVVVLTTMAARSWAGTDAAEVFTTTQLAQMTGLQAPTVAKLMKQLAHGGLLESQRGASGGYRLARGPLDISVADMVTTMEGPIALAACVEGAETSCNVENCCPMAGNWNQVNLAIKSALEGITLADMVSPNIAITPAAGLAAWRTGVPDKLEVKG